MLTLKSAMRIRQTLYFQGKLDMCAIHDTIRQHRKLFDITQARQGRKLSNKLDPARYLRLTTS